MLKRLLSSVTFAFVLAGPSHAQFCPGTNGWVFDDVPASDLFCGYITWAAQNGITQGCLVIDANHRLYCPNDAVPRAQMAAFLGRLATNSAFAQGGNAFGSTAVLGTNDNQALEIRANGNRVMRYEPSELSPNVVGGSPANNLTPGVRGATIGGGGLPLGDTDPDVAGSEGPNRVTDLYGTIGGGLDNQAGDAAGTIVDAMFATVGGGFHNTASGQGTTVGGGAANTASGSVAVVAGGSVNAASGTASTIGGGTVNLASGYTATVPGGVSNEATGDYSFAAGTRAKATHNYSFVWGGSGNVDTSSAAHGDFVVYAPAAVRMLVGAPGTGGCTLTSGASGWACSSDRSLKANVAPVDASAMLSKVVSLPIAHWTWSSIPGVLHVGPMAQDFHAAFELGDDPTRLAFMDVQGVALSAIQGLNAKLEATVAEQAREIVVQRARLADLEARYSREIGELRQAVEVLMARSATEVSVAAR